LSAPLPESFYRRISSEVEEMKMRELTDVIAIVCIGLLVGTEFAVAAFVNPILRKMGAREEIMGIRMFAEKLGFVMPFWYSGSLVLLIAEFFLHRANGDGGLLIASGVIWVAVIVLSMVFLVPINNRMTRLDPETASTSELKDHKRWDGMHRWRVAALAGAMICFLLAVVRPG
jgi:uncharacterized membrane protein